MTARRAEIDARLAEIATELDWRGPVTVQAWGSYVVAIAETIVEDCAITWPIDRKLDRLALVVEARKLAAERVEIMRTARIEARS